MAFHQAPYLDTFALRMTVKTDTQPPLSGAVRSSGKGRRLETRKGTDILSSGSRPLSLRGAVRPGQGSRR